MIIYVWLWVSIFGPTALLKAIVIYRLSGEFICEKIEIPRDQLILPQIILYIRAGMKTKFRKQFYASLAMLLASILRVQQRQNNATTSFWDPAY